MCGKYSSVTVVRSPRRTAANRPCRQRRAADCACRSAATNPRSRATSTLLQVRPCRPLCPSDFRTRPSRRPTSIRTASLVDRRSCHRLLQITRGLAEHDLNPLLDRLPPSPLRIGLGNDDLVDQRSGDLPPPHDRRLVRSQLGGEILRRGFDPVVRPVRFVIVFHAIVSDMRSASLNPTCAASVAACFFSTSVQ